MPRAHTLALFIVLWGLAVGAQQVLPRTGYMTITAAASAARWFCPGYSPREILTEIRNNR
jgi:hypothetical protein